MASWPAGSPKSGGSSGSNGSWATDIASPCLQPGAPAPLGGRPPDTARNAFDLAATAAACPTGGTKERPPEVLDNGRSSDKGALQDGGGGEGGGGCSDIRGDARGDGGGVNLCAPNGGVRGVGPVAAAPAGGDPGLPLAAALLRLPGPRAPPSAITTRADGEGGKDLGDAGGDGDGVNDARRADSVDCSRAHIKYGAPAA
jgi:hypothetical protein